jgi:long-chain acyl-CoA synthetase
MITHLLDALQLQLRTRADAVALIVPIGDSPRSFSWRQLGQMIAPVVGNLDRVWRDQPTIPRRIGHASDNSLADVLVALASMATAAVEVPIDHRLEADDIEARWKRIGGHWLGPQQRDELIAKALAATSDREPLIELAGLSESEGRSRGDPDQPSLVLWTSGTTGTPQGVKLSQRNLCGNAAAKLGAVPQTVDDVRLCALPLCHAYARTCDFGTWLLSGCTLALTLGFEGWQELAPSALPTLANTVPGLSDRLLRGDARGLGLQRLRLLGCGGAAMSKRSFGAWKDRGVTVIQGYGLTETAPVICSATPEDAQSGLVGKFVAGWEHEIRAGRLFVRGPHNMLGYWGDETATAAKIDGLGWLDTRDLVEIDATTQQLRILGRADDVIVLASGRKLNPWPLEHELEQVDGVRHAMLVGRCGRLELWIDHTDGFDRASLMSALRARPSWQQPSRVSRWEPPLSIAAGELTAKGTKRRKRITENRF